MSLELNSCVLIDYRLWAAKSEGRQWVEQCIEQCIEHPPEPRSGLCPELLADFGFRTSWVLAGGAEGSFLCSLSSRFSGRGGGVGSLPRAWRRVGVPGAAGAKKIVRLASVFPSPPFRSSDFAGLRRPRLYGFHTGTRSLSNRKGRGRRSGGREREPRRAGEGRLVWNRNYCFLIEYP